MTRSIVFLALLVLSPAAHAKSFAADADVVLISGMAGDVETETEYEEIAGNLINWLKSAEASPASVTVFADTGAEWKDDRFPIQKFEARKAALQKFLETRKSAERPLVCLLWGHGGEQKGTPIFHVKGPRLEPNDLKELTNTSPDQPSFWVLSFRYSGAFAKAVASERADTLSSENEMVFNSDPMLMLQASRLLRESPDLDFEAFAKETGRRIDALYKGKGVARTEDPILWNGTERPAYVIPKEAGLVQEDPKVDDTKVEGQKEDPPPGRPVPVSNESREVWKTIKAVDPKQYPGDDAVFLSRSIRYVLGGNPAMQMEQDQFIQILSTEGTENGDIQLSYSPPETLHIVDCEVRKPDGTIIRLASEKFADIALDREPGYGSLQRKAFSFPEVVPGSILRLHYIRTWKNFPLPHLFVEANVGLPIPSLKTEVEIRVSKSMAFHTLLQNLPEVQPELETTAYGKRYTWRWENLPAQNQEVLGPNESAGRLQASTFPNWNEFAEWYERLIRLADTPNEAIKQKAAELTKDAKTELEKVEAIYNYVTALRYVMIPLGVNSHRPHSAENTFANQFGDCKDKANLFNTMLRTLGIEAYLVLVPRMSQADESMPGMAFNHAISQVRLKDQTLWIDTTDPTCRFGMLPPGDPGRKVLVIDGKSRSLEVLPYPDLDSQTMRVTGTVDLTNPVEPSSSVRVVPGGYSDYLLRAAAGAWGAKSAFPIMLEYLRTPNGVFVLEEQKVGPIADLSKETWWEASGKWTGLLTDLDEQGKKQVIRAPIWLPEEWILAGNRRTSDAQLNKGYPLRLDETVKFKLPPGAQLSGLRKAGGEQNGLFKWSCEWRAGGPGEIELKFVADLARGDLTKDEMGKLAGELHRMQAAISTGPILQR